ncbi:uncharacterized protein [Branchiostoma lanceolatum]|uniref:uncharacterized protein n=1 Tax=Branchiostoma lanceolatum TaxID=7740 RepID=UPI00345608EF
MMCRAAAVGSLGLLWVITAAFTCPEICSCRSREVYCQDRGLKHVPSNIPLETTFYRLDSNTIQNLPAIGFSNLIGLIRLDLYYNNISVLPDGVFSNLTSLEFLYLNNNNIRALPDGVFSNLISLEELYLNNNNIRVLPDGVFSNLVSLEELSLHTNIINALPNRVFYNLTSLRWLNLHNNNIRALPNKVFSNPIRLVWLSLSYNNISVLPDGVFSNLISLQELSLHNNNIHALPDGVFSNLVSLLLLRLRKNNMENLTPRIGPGEWQNFVVRVGPNETFSKNDQCGHTYKAPSTTRQTFLVHCDPPIPGRYVSVQIMGVEAILTLCEVEVYITETCCAEPSIDNGKVEGSYCYQQTVNVSCNAGYHLVGPESMECTAMGTWDCDPTCNRTCCAEPFIDNGKVEGSYCYQQTVHVLCNDDYHLVGPESMKCTVNGTWDNKFPICENLSTSAIGCITAAVAVVVIGAGMVIFLRRTRLKRMPVEASALPPGIPPRPQSSEFEVDPARLKIGQKIGRGAFGVVSRAILQEDGETRDVAVKTLTASAGDDDKFSFLQEIRAVADLGLHENLLGLIGCCTLVGDHLYLITEFMPYGDLKGFLGKCKEARKSETYYESTSSVYNFEEKEVYKVSWQIAKGMVKSYGGAVEGSDAPCGSVFQNHISQADYVHGDLAARNVLVGDNLHVKISDFGLADHMYSRGYRRQDRLQRIPWKWMAPERLADGERYTTQSDVWSFGILLYEIATLGGSPYPGMPTAGLVDQLKSGYRMSQPDDCPDPLYNLMLQCWSLDPEERPFFSKLAAVLDDLFSSHVDDYTEFISGSPVDGNES